MIKNIVQIFDKLHVRTAAPPALREILAARAERRKAKLLIPNPVENRTLKRRANGRAANALRKTPGALNRGRKLSVRLILRAAYSSGVRVAYHSGAVSASPCSSFKHLFYTKIGVLR